MAINTIDGFYIGSSTPIDTRITAADTTERTSIVYKYDGSNHEPNHVRVLWGNLIFFGRLESMSVEYTLFKPGGEPLRAKIKLSFSGLIPLNFASEPSCPIASLLL